MGENKPQLDDVMQFARQSKIFSATKRRSNESSLLICLWVLAFGMGLVITLMMLQAKPEEVRKNGVLLDGEVIRVSSSRMGTGSPTYRAQVKIMKDGAVVKEDHSFIISISNYNKFFAGEKVKVWEYNRIFYLDEYDNMEQADPCILILSEVLCFSIIAFIYLRRRKRGQIN
jgi:hypothetical protein